MFGSNMKILAVNSKQNTPLSTPNLNQQRLVQTDAGGSNTPMSKEFTSLSNAVGSTQKSSGKGRDQHQKHSGGNKNKFVHGSNSNKMQQSQPQKFHQNSGNNKNKKQNYNNTNSSSSSFNRKKYYQQPQMPYHHHQQQQYMPTAVLTSPQQRLQTLTPPNNKNNTNVNRNNNSNSVKNQNYTMADTSMSVSNNINQNNNTKQSTVSDGCTCGAFESNCCDKLSSSTELQSQNHNSLKTSPTATTSGNVSSAVNSGHINPTVPNSTDSDCTCTCWYNNQNLPPQTKSGKSNKGGKLSASANNTNLQEFVAAAFAHKCGCSAQMSSTVSNVTPQAAVSSTKKSFFWKNANNHEGSGGDNISSGSASPKSSNDKVIVPDKKPLKNPAKLTEKYNTTQQKETVQKGGVIRAGSNSESKVTTKVTAVVNSVPSVENSSPSDITVLASSDSQQHSSAGATKKNSDVDQVVVKDSMIRKDSDSKLEKNEGNIGPSPTAVSGHSPPNSYSLDFLHSVGEQMTGGGNHDSKDTPMGNVKHTRSSAVAGTLNPHLGRNSGNSPARGKYSYSGNSNPRQPRYMYGGGGGNNPHHYQGQQQHHPSQLTIASFLQKDLLGENNLGQITNGGGMGGSNKYNEQQGNRQQHYTRQRYHHNYFPSPHYQQQQVLQNPGTSHSTYNGSYGKNNGGMMSNMGNQKSVYGGYLNYGNNLLQYHHPNPAHRNNQVQTNGGETNSNNGSKKTHVSSSASSCSSSSSSSKSSKSTYGNHRKQQQQQQQPHTIQSEQKSTSTSNSAIETVTSKTPNQQRQGHHKGGHYHGHNHNQHHSHQQAMSNSPTTPQHQNYYNLTYVSTDGQRGTINTATSRGCSPAPQSIPPTTCSNSTDSPKTLENASNSNMPMLPPNLQPGQVNYSRFSHVQNSTPPPNFPNYSQQNYSNHKFLAPLSLAVPPPSPTPPHVTGALPAQQLPIGPHIICCSQLDEASTAAAAAAATTGTIAGNDYESDTPSTAIVNAAKHRKHQPVKTLALSSPTSSSSSVSATGAHSQQDCHNPPNTPLTVGTSTTPLHSPLDFAYAPTAAMSAFPCIQAPPTGSQLSQQQLLSQNPMALKPAANLTATQLSQMYRNNGVISLLNLPNLSPVGYENSCGNYLEDDYHQRQQHAQLYLTHQSSAEHLNMVSTLSLAVNNNRPSSDYWSPSQQSNFLYQQLSSGPNSLMSSSTPSCGSSSASISPSIPDRGEEFRHLATAHLQLPSSGSSSPSSCLSDQLGGNQCSTTIVPPSSANSSSSSSSVSGKLGGCSIETLTESDFKRGSTQFLAPQQQRLIAHQMSSSLVNSTSSVITNTFRSRSGSNNGRNHQNHSSSTSSLLGGNSTSSVPQQPFPHLYSHQHQQSLPLPPQPHNLLYNNPQAHQLRPLNNSSMHDFSIHTPPDRFLARSHLVEVKEAPASLLNNSKWDNLSLDIWRKFASSQQTEETYRQKMLLWRCLYLIIKGAFPRFGLYLVGSTISGFGADTSDVDMCLVARSASSVEPRIEALYNLTILQDTLTKSGEFENFNLIEAKVPILRFRQRAHQLEVDLNFNNCVGIKNTHLLHCYSQIDWRVRPLVLVTKLWAQHHNINNAKNMTISSYSLVLMVIHFLQYAVNPPVLPCLHDMFPDKFPLVSHEIRSNNDFGYVDMSEMLGPYESKNDKSIGELFLSFLEYYSSFDYTQFAISVRTGGILPVPLCRLAKSPKNDVHQWKELCIEEPFDLTNTARSVYDYETFERVKSVFVSSWHVLQRTLDLNSVFLPIAQFSSATTSPQRPSIPREVVNMVGVSRQISSVIPISSITANEVETEKRHSSTNQNAKYGDANRMQTECYKPISNETKCSASSSTSVMNSSPIIKHYDANRVQKANKSGDTMPS